MGAIPRDIDSVEAVEYPRKVPGSVSLARVRDFSRDEVVSDDNSYSELATRSGLSQGVDQEVRQDLIHPIRVGVDDGWFRSHLSLDQAFRVQEAPRPWSRNHARGD